jgi:hypothetical protein
VFGCSSIQEYRQHMAARRAAAADNAAMLRDPTIPGERKHALRMAAYVQHGRSAFTCPGCWQMRGTCICGRLPRFKPSTEVGGARRSWSQARAAGR